MKLFDVIFGDGQLLPRLKDEIHRGGVTRHFLLVARLEGFSFQAGEKRFNFLIAQAHALDASRRTDALNRVVLTAMVFVFPTILEHH